MSKNNENRKVSNAVIRFEKQNSMLKLKLGNPKIQNSPSSNKMRSTSVISVKVPDLTIDFEKRLIMQKRKENGQTV
jgi:hypothetical protein